MKFDKGLVAGSSTMLVLSLLEGSDMYGVYRMNIEKTPDGAKIDFSVKYAFFLDRSAER